MRSARTTQLATDTHGHTDVAMELARLLGFDLCPRLKALSDRHLFLPKGSDVPDAVRAIVRTRIDPAKIVAQWDRIVHLAASVHAGHASAVEALSRYGSAARGDPLYEALVQLSQLLRTVFLADYFVNDPFRRELLRVLNRGESVNALKRAIYTGRVATFQAKRHDELAAVGKRPKIRVWPPAAHARTLRLGSRMHARRAPLAGAPSSTQHTSSSCASSASLSISFAERTMSAIHISTQYGSIVTTCTPLRSGLARSRAASSGNG